MKPSCFFMKSLIALALFSFCFAMESNAQAPRGNKPKLNVDSSRTQFDLALISCKTSWLGNGIVNVEWTVRNDGRGTCPLLDKEGQPLVSYTVDGSTSIKDGSSQATGGGSWSPVAEPASLDITSKDLAPGQTATGSFTFDTKSGVWNHEEQVVSYRVSLNCGIGDLKQQNNVYVGQIGK
jgi:hypothetical protein